VASADSANSADKSGGTAGPQSPDAIEREMEETRIRLAATIDELVDRTSPKRVVRREVASVRATFIDEHGNPRTDNILKVAGGVAGFVVLLVVIRRATR
jgi:hypothetical protein